MTDESAYGTGRSELRGIWKRVEDVKYVGIGRQLHLADLPRVQN